jgi:hypothetical protein
MRVVPYPHWRTSPTVTRLPVAVRRCPTQDFLCGVDPAEPVDPGAFAAEVAAGRITGPPEVLANPVR